MSVNVLPILTVEKPCPEEYAAAPELISLGIPGVKRPSWDGPSGALEDAEKIPAVTLRWSMAAFPTSTVPVTVTLVALAVRV